MGAAWTMTPRKELLDDVPAAPINEVCSASGHALKVAGAGRAVFKGADGKPVVLHDVLLVPDLKANLISLRKLAKAGVSTSTDGARTYKGQLGDQKNQPKTKVSQQIEQITRQLDLTPSVSEEGEEAAAEGGDEEKIQEAPAGGGVGVEASGCTSEAARPEGADVAEQQLGNEEALLILPYGNDPEEEDEPAYCFLAPAPEEPASMEEALAGPDREKWLGQVTIYKSRLVAKGFMLILPHGYDPDDEEEQDFNEIFAPIAKPPTLRLASEEITGGYYDLRVALTPPQHEAP
ncbi:unnamed protein product [Closterium sp. NIES-54]